MAMRFRIHAGEEEGELLAATLEELRELVTAGKVAPDDLMYDALAGRVGAARTHAAYRLVCDPFLEEATAPELRLDLVEATGPTREDAARAFLESMDRERRADPDLSPLSREIAVQGARGDPGPQGAPPVADLPGTRDEVGESAVEGSSAERTRGSEFDQEDAHAALARAVARGALPLARTLRRARASRAGLVIAIGITAVAVAAVPALKAGPGLSLPWREAGGVSAVSSDFREVDVRTEAWSALLGSLEALRDGLQLQTVPPYWMEGRYLAEPSAYADVRRFWERTLQFVDAARTQEEALYRSAYVAALDGRDVEGPLRSLRLATALTDFAAARPVREAHYLRISELAEVALALHDSLLRLEGRIHFEPAVGPRVSRDPIVEAVASDAESRVSLEGAVDPVLEALLRGGLGARTRGRVPGWLVGGLRGPSRAEAM